jgi:hypothetical protein
VPLHTALLGYAYPVSITGNTSFISSSRMWSRGTLRSQE